MGVKKQMGNNHVSKINDNFQKNLIGCGLGAFSPSFFSCLSQSSRSLSPHPTPFLFFFFFFFVWGWRLEKKRKGEKRQDNRLDPSA